MVRLRGWDGVRDMTEAFGASLKMTRLECARIDWDRDKCDFYAEWSVSAHYGPISHDGIAGFSSGHNYAELEREIRQWMDKVFLDQLKTLICAQPQIEESEKFYNTGTGELS